MDPGVDKQMGVRLSALGRFANRGYIRDILRPSSRQLCGNQVRAGNEERFKPGFEIDHCLNAVGPRTVKINSVDLRQKVHHHRLMATPTGLHDAMGTA